MHLTHHIAVIFCAGGAISQAVARALHGHGATVVLAARRLSTAQALHDQLSLSDLIAEVVVLNEAAVETFLEEVHARYGRLDSVFNGVGPRAADPGYGQLAADLPLATFLDLHRLVVGGQFVTGSAAGRVWRRRETCGTLVLLTSSLSRLKMSGMSGLAAASAAVEGLTRAFAAELGEIGCGAVCVNATALPETRTIQETTALQAARIGSPPEALAQGMAQGSLLKRAPSLPEIGELVAFLLSPAGAVLNSHIVDADCGTTSVI